MALISGQSVNGRVRSQVSFSKDFSEAAGIAAYCRSLGDLYWVYTPARFKKDCKNIKTYTDGYVKSALRCIVKNQETSEDSSEQFVFIKELQDELSAC